MRLQSWRVLAAGLVLVLPAAAFGQPDAPGAKGPPPAAAEVRFSNGSSLYMQVDQPQFAVETKYGKLSIPTREIRLIEFGFHTDEQTRQQVQELARKLAGQNFQEREQAAQQLTALGRKAYPLLRELDGQGDLESRQRVEKVMKAIEDRVPARLLNRAAEDVVYTSKFPVAGRVVTPAIEAVSEDFGKVTLTPEQLYSIQWFAGTGKSSVAVDAAKFRRSETKDTWVKTDVTVPQKVRLKLKAAGKVDLYPTSPGGITSGPEGLDTNQYGLGGIAALAYQQNPVLNRPGALVGKIGENGTPFLVGRETSMTPAQSGLLYLRIGPSHMEEAATGSFQVQVLTGPFADE